MQQVDVHHPEQALSADREGYAFANLAGRDTKSQGLVVFDFASVQRENEVSGSESGFDKRALGVQAADQHANWPGRCLLDQPGKRQSYLITASRNDAFDRLCLGGLG